MVKQSYEKLTELGLVPSSSPPLEELFSAPAVRGQDEWSFPLALWIAGGMAVHLSYQAGEVPDYGADLAAVAALEGNPYRIRDISVLPPEPHLLTGGHGFLRGPVSHLSYRSGLSCEHRALLTAMPAMGKGENYDLGKVLPREPLPDGRCLLLVTPVDAPPGPERSLVAVLADPDAVAAYVRWAGARRGAQRRPASSWRVARPEPQGDSASEKQVAEFVGNGVHPVLAQAVAVPERVRWDGNAQLEELVAADRSSAERGLRATWETTRGFGPDTSGEAERSRKRAVTAAVLLAEVFGDEGPLREAVGWPPDEGEWGRLHPAGALAPALTLKGHDEVRRRVLGPRVLESLRADLADTAGASGEAYRITPFVTIAWATMLALDDRVNGRSTAYRPLVARHGADGNQGFVEKVLAAARAGSPDADWLREPFATSEALESHPPLTGADGLWRALVASGLLPDAVVSRGVDFARSIPYLQDEDPEGFAVQVVEKAGVGRAIGREGEFEPPYEDVLRAVDEVSGGRVRIEGVSQEWVAGELLTLRWTQDGVARRREVPGYGRFMDTDEVRAVLPRVVDEGAGRELQLWEIEDAVVVLWARPGAAERYADFVRGVRELP